MQIRTVENELESILIVLDSLQGGDHRPGVPIRTDRGNMVVSCFLLPIGWVSDSYDRLAILANDGLLSTFGGGPGRWGRDHHVRRIFIEIRVLGILVFAGGLVLGTRPRFRNHGGALHGASGRPDDGSSSGAGLPTDKFPNHCSAHAATDCATPPSCAGVESP